MPVGQKGVVVLGPGDHGQVEIAPLIGGVAADRTAELDPVDPLVGSQDGHRRLVQLAVPAIDGVESTHCYTPKARS